MVDINTYDATIIVKDQNNNTSFIKVTVQAAFRSDAEALLEAQYGPGCIQSGPWPR